jgi:hypothetical protein
VVAGGFDDLAGQGDDRAGLVVDVLIAAEVAGIVEGDLIRGFCGRRLVCAVGGFVVVGQQGLVAGEELGVVLDLGGDAVGAPVGGDGADAVRTDGDDLLDLGGLEGLEAGFGEALEDQIVAETTSRVAGAFLFLEDAEGGAEVGHDAGEVGDDLAALGVVAAHAAEPEAVLLGAVEDGEGLLRDELVALHRAETEGVSGLLEGEEELGAVGVLPDAGVGGAAAEADEDGQVLDADRALELAGAAGGALEGRFHRHVAGGRVVGGVFEGVDQKGLAGERAEGVEVGAGAEDDLLGIEDFAGVGGGAVLGAAAALDAAVGLQADELGEVLAGDQAVVLVAEERGDFGEAVALEEDGQG